MMNSFMSEIFCLRNAMKVMKIVILAPLSLFLFAISTPVFAQQGARKFELQPIAPKFSTLIPPTATLETVATGFGFTEGPVWDPVGFLYVSDEELNKIFRVDLSDGRKEELISLGDPDGNTYDRHGRLIGCASVLRAIIAISKDGKYKILADHFEGKKFNSPND